METTESGGTGATGGSFAPGAQIGTSSYGDGERTLHSAPANDRTQDAAASAEENASRSLSRELDNLLDRLPGLVGEDRDKAKAEFLKFAAKSTRTTTELVAKSADVAKRVTGRVKNEWETGRECAESFINAHPLRAASIALGIGILLGAKLFGHSRRDRSL